MTTQQKDEAREQFEAWLGSETCPVYESANKNAWYGWEAGRLAGLEQAAKINSVLLEALERILAQAESWHRETGHEDDDPIIQCDGICACIPQMKAAILLAKGEPR